jgi:outer membrane protein assembly factor BamB
MMHLEAAIAVLLWLMPQAAPPAAQADWPQWRGPNRDGLSSETGLLKQWPSGGPPVLWEAKGVGRGYATVVVAGGRVYTMGDDGPDGPDEHVSCLEEATGKQVWKAKVGPAYNKHGKNESWNSSRATPTLDGDRLYALTPNGSLVCLETAAGKERWRKDLRGNFGGRVGGWGYAESPLIDGDNVVCTPGGRQGAVLALKKESGEKVWQSAQFTDEAEYASLVPAVIGGVRQYVVLTMQSVVGIAAQDGKLLWRVARQGRTAVIPTPIVKNDLVFVTSGYSVGCNAFKVTGSGAQEVYAGKQLAIHHGGAILVGDHVYGLDDGGSLKCIELATGREVWAGRSVGKGSIAYADGHLVCRSERGPVALVEATPSGYKEKGRLSPSNRSGRPSWAHPVVAGQKLFLRDGDSILCYDLRSK